ncbi:MAG: protein-glutamate O-methyltransferase [Oligoflexia bacterium]|nr:protein-glutamate O-methyltransferase [Oligoflexia bacterium]MBF0364337.1 protein-glutamate O-methyltransferase [Oligoflexia bacterium]
MSVLDISDSEFALFQKLVLGLLGIKLTESKRALIVSRLYTRLKELKLENFTEYILYLKNNNNSKVELREFINRITTNETFFFREKGHFDFLAKTLIPEFIDKYKNRELRIWSSACSSGEEPYTIAMTVYPFIKAHPGFHVKILATDISTKVLEKAKAGVYSQESLAKVPVNLHATFFEVHSPDKVQVRPELRSMITFKEFNLMSQRYPLKSPVDIIFCRNVMIYFSEEGKNFVLSKFSEHLQNQGYLFIGHSESLMSNQYHFELLQNTIYRKME